tara:strand:+ start:3508 stop:4023 length:516 start_codon:yes stop_codon:yes gene_type:complete
MSSINTPTFKQLFSHPTHFWAFGFGSGLAPKAPGTFGTLAAVPIYVLIQDWSLWFYLPFVLLTYAIGVWFCDRSSKDLGVHDHGGIVWDEMVGYWLTMLLAPKGWLWILLGFVLFRVFDIFKPWPIGPVDEKIHGGMGIMLDDVLAAVYAGIGVQALAWYFQAGIFTVPVF